jgi:hypothetical protein
MEIIEQELSDVAVMEMGSTTNIIARKTKGYQTILIEKENTIPFIVAFIEESGVNKKTVIKYLSDDKND